MMGHVPILNSTFASADTFRRPDRKADLSAAEVLMDPARLEELLTDPDLDPDP
jgi:hypothetical protein